MDTPALICTHLEALVQPGTESSSLIRFDSGSVTSAPVQWLMRADIMIGQDIGSVSGRIGPTDHPFRV